MATRSEDIVKEQPKPEKSNIRSGVESLLQKVHELDLGSTLESVHNELLLIATNQELLSELYLEALKPASSGVPYHISPTEPESIQVFKKLTNIIYNAEQAIKNLENISLDDEEYLIIFAAKHSGTVAKNLYTINDAIDLVNHSGESIQAIFGPQIERFAPKFEKIAIALNEVSPSGSASELAQKVGAVAGKGINQLPTSESLSDVNSFEAMASFVTGIPGLINEMTVLIQSKPSPDKKSSISAEEHHKQVEKNTKKLADRMNKIAMSSSKSNYIKLVRRLAKESLNIVDATGPLTTASYEEAKAQLNHFKHELLPELLTEIESIEQSMGLKPGTLSEPVLQSINEYYQKAVGALEQNAKFQNAIVDATENENARAHRAARKILLGSGRKMHGGEKLTHDILFSLLTDNKFEQNYRKKQDEHSNQARVSLLIAKTKEKAFDEFIKLLQEENTFLNDGQMSYINPEKKMELGVLYAQCQEYVHDYNENLDKQIVSALHLTDKELQEIQRRSKEPISPTFWSKASSALATTAWGALVVAKNLGGGAANVTVLDNDFADVLGAQKAIKISIEKDIANKQLRCDMIDESIEASKSALYENHHQITLLYPIESLPPIETFTFNPDASENELYERLVATKFRLDDIEKAKGAFAQFNEKLRQYQGQGHSGITSLSEEQKESLRQDYKLFQPYLYHMHTDLDEDYLQGLDTQMVSLLLEVDDVSDIPFNQLLSSSQQSNHQDLESKFNEYLDDISLIVENNGKKYGNQIVKQQSKPTELKEFKAEKRKVKTLFQELADQQLSKKSHDFLHSTLIPSLKENLSDEILQSLQLDNEKLPYKIDIAEDERVKLYKELINSFHNLEKGLSNFENAVDQKSQSGLWFYGKTVGYDIGKPLNDAVNSLNKVSGNPQLETVIKNAKDFLGPIQSNPMLRSEGTSPETKPEKVSKSSLNQLNSAASTFRHKMVDMTNTEAKKLVKNIDSAQELYMDRFEQLVNESIALGTELAEEVELDPHAITKAIRAIQEENQNTLNAQLEIYAQTIEHGPPHPDWIKIEPLRKRLNEISEEIKSKGHIAPDTIPRMNAIYREIRPYLNEEVADTFTDVFFTEMDGFSPDSLLDKVEELNQELDFSFAKPPGPFDILNRIYYDFDTDFSDGDIQEEIKAQYSAIQPYMQKFNAKYTPDYIERLIEENRLEKGLGDMVKRDFMPAERQAMLDLLAPAFQQPAHDIKTLINFLYKSKSKELQPFQVYRQLLGDQQTDYNSPEIQNNIKKQFMLMQPLLEKVDQKYNESYLNNIKTGEAYEKLLQDIIHKEFPKVNKNLVTAYVGKHHPHRNLFIKVLTELQSTKLNMAPNIKDEPKQAPKNEDESSTLENAIANMYKLPAAIESVKNGDIPSDLPPLNNTEQQKVDEVLGLLKKANFKPSGLKAYMKVADELLLQVRTTGIEVNDAIMEHLPNLRDEYITNVVIQADAMEIELGLRPGRLSEPLNGVFDSFYSGLVQNINQINDQRDLELQIATINIELRTDAAQTRLNDVENALQKIKSKKETGAKLSEAELGEEKKLQLEQKLYQNQLAYFKELKQAKINEGLDKINHFKSLVFEQKVHAIVRSDFESKEKGIGANAIFKLLKHEIENNKESYIGKVTLMDDIDAVIEENVIGAYQALYDKLQKGEFEPDKINTIREIETQYTQLDKHKNDILKNFKEHSPIRKVVENYFAQIEQSIEELDLDNFDAESSRIIDSMVLFENNVDYYRYIKIQVKTLDKEYKKLLKMDKSSLTVVERDLLQEQQEAVNSVLEDLAKNQGQSPSQIQSKIDQCIDEQKLYQKVHHSAQILEQISKGLDEEIRWLNEIPEQMRTRKEKEDLNSFKELQQKTEGLKNIIQDKNRPLQQRVSDLNAGIEQAVGPELNKPKSSIFVRMFKKILSLFKSLDSEDKHTDDKVKDFKDRLKAAKTRIEEKATNIVQIYDSASL